LNGTRWRLDRAAEKLNLRAELPGARLFDLAADALRTARAAGASRGDRLALALPASWCVNSPAPSTVLRRWALAPQREVWELLMEVFDESGGASLDADSRRAVMSAIAVLGPEPYGVEAISKVLALLAPDAVPLMPSPARTFVLGESQAQTPDAFVAMLEWFSATVGEVRLELTACARGHTQVPLSAAQVLDRLLWFDSEGYRHFPSFGV
jgi:hypothetical protein